MSGSCCWVCSVLASFGALLPEAALPVVVAAFQPWVVHISYRQDSTICHTSGCSPSAASMWGSSVLPNVWACVEVEVCVDVVEACTAAAVYAVEMEVCIVVVEACDL